MRGAAGGRRKKETERDESSLVKWHFGMKHSFPPGSEFTCTRHFKADQSQL